MNWELHRFIGLVATLIVGFFLMGGKIEPFGMSSVIVIGGAFVSLGGSVFPDVLEPYRHGRRHRYVFHSKRLLKITGWLSLILFIIIGIIALLGFGVNSLFIIFAFVLGYFLHLAADSITHELPD